MLNRLRPSHHPQPGVRHQRGSRSCRMNAVPGPFLWRSISDGLVEHRLERDEDCFMRRGYSLGGRPVLVELRKPFLVDGAAAQNKGFTDYQFHLGQGVARAVQ